MKKHKMNYGFTLAEVLITLGIIGVIATMTIPTLINSYQNKANETAFKKSYSVINNAMTQVVQENGGIPYKCYYWNGVYHTECAELFKALKNKLQVAKIYTGAVDGINIPNYIGTDKLTAIGGTWGNPSCNGGIDASKGTKTAWTLSDSSMLISYSDNFWSALFILDTNGLKKPNKWGYDIFMINFGANGRLEDNVCYAYEKSGKRINKILLGN